MANEKRLIDANALRERHCDECKEDIREMCRTDPLCAVLMWVDEEPTVDAVEVVHAYWIGEEPGDWNCSHCGEYAADGGYEQTRYCPHCGAKMDGERRNDV